MVELIYRIQIEMNTVQLLTAKKTWQNTSANEQHTNKVKDQIQ